MCVGVSTATGGRFYADVAEMRHMLARRTHREWDLAIDFPVGNEPNYGKAPLAVTNLKQISQDLFELRGSVRFLRGWKNDRPLYGRPWKFRGEAERLKGWD